MFRRTTASSNPQMKLSAKGEQAEALNLIAMGVNAHSNLRLIHERSSDPSSANDSEQDNHNGQHQKYVNKAAHGGGSD